CRSHDPGDTANATAINRGDVGGWVKLVHGEVPAALDGHRFVKIKAATTIAADTDDVGLAVTRVGGVDGRLHRGVVGVVVVDTAELQPRGKGLARIAGARAVNVNIDRSLHLKKA